MVILADETHHGEQLDKRNWMQRTASMMCTSVVQQSAGSQPEVERKEFRGILQHLVDSGQHVL